MEHSNSQVTVGIYEYDKLRDRSEKLKGIEEGKSVVEYYKADIYGGFKRHRIDILHPDESEVIVNKQLEEAVSNQKGAIEAMSKLKLNWEQRYHNLKQERDGSWLTSMFGTGLLGAVVIAAIIGWIQVARLINLIPN